jgi:2'-5' RNA ligase
MGVIEENDLPEVSKILQEIASNFHELKLTANNCRNNKIPSGDVVSGFTIEKTDELQSLHEMIMGKLKPFLTYEVSMDMIFSPPAGGEITLYWIKNYAERSSFEKFKPHITIGLGGLDNVNLPTTFTASTLTLCHLGNYCTCRKILFSTKLEK